LIVCKVKLEGALKMIETLRTFKKPNTCGECERFFIDESGETFCYPVKQKHGLEIVECNQKPSINCPYLESHCINCGSPLHLGNCLACDSPHLSKPKS
jgi:hypothetical protein